MLLSDEESTLFPANSSTTQSSRPAYVSLILPHECKWAPIFSACQFLRNQRREVKPQLPNEAFFIWQQPVEKYSWEPFSMQLGFCLFFFLYAAHRVQNIFCRVEDSSFLNVARQITALLLTNFFSFFVLSVEKLIQTRSCILLLTATLSLNETPCCLFFAAWIAWEQLLLQCWTPPPYLTMGCSQLLCCFLVAS